jgi:hypothetical protein
MSDASVILDGAPVYFEEFDGYEFIGEEFEYLPVWANEDFAEIEM